MLLYGNGPSTPPGNVQVIDLTLKGVLTALTPRWLKRVGHASRSIGARAGKEADPWQPTFDGEELDLDKSWHGIHFLLTGTAYEGEPPLDFIVRGGVQIGGADVGVDPPRALKSDEVRAVADAIEGLSPDDLRERFDSEQMLEEGIYPDIWDRDTADDDSLEYLIEHYTELRAFVHRAAERGDGFIIVM